MHFIHLWIKWEKIICQYFDNKYPIVKVMEFEFSPFDSRIHVPQNCLFSKVKNYWSHGILVPLRGPQKTIFLKIKILFVFRLSLDFHEYSTIWIISFLLTKSFFFDEDHLFKQSSRGSGVNFSVKNFHWKMKVLRTIENLC